MCVGGPQDSNCTPLQVPPFQESPKPPPNNVLVIPTQQQAGEGDFCDPNGGRTMVSLAQDNYLANTQFKRTQGLDCSGPQRMVIGDCYAEFDGCELRDGTPTGRSCVGAAWRTGFGPRDAAFRVVHDSDPNWGSELLRGSACPGEPLIIFNPPHDQVPPPPPPSEFCVAPCVLTQQGDGMACVCDPPIPSNVPSPTPIESFISRVASMFSTPSTPVGSPEETAVRAEERAQIEEARLEFSEAFLMLNPTRRRGLPFHFKKCDCENDQDEPVELIDDGV